MKNKRNPIAKQLRTSQFRKRIVASKKKMQVLKRTKSNNILHDWRDEIKYD